MGVEGENSREGRGRERQGKAGREENRREFCSRSIDIFLIIQKKWFFKIISGIDGEQDDS